MEDLEKGAYVVVGGRIFNQLPQRDEFGLQSGSGKKEYTVIVVKSVIEKDDIDEKDISLFTKAQKLQMGESMALVVKEDSDEDVNSEDFD